MIFTIEAFLPFLMISESEIADLLQICRGCGYIGHNKKTQTYIHTPICIRKFDASGEALGKPIHLRSFSDKVQDRNSKIFPVHAVKAYGRHRCMLHSFCTLTFGG
jgi:hypothetical protein